MAYELLGARFDIHGGGNDLTFPHHENEIAQSTCAGHGFANVWMHNEMLQVEGKKMSKSLGNFFTVRDLLDGNWSGGWKVPGEVIRFVFLSTHYGKPMDWTEAKARQAEKELAKWRQVTVGIKTGHISEKLVTVLSDDLNTHGAIHELRGLFKARRYEDLSASAQLLGLLTDSLKDWEWEPVQFVSGGGLKNANRFSGGEAIPKEQKPSVFYDTRVEQRSNEIVRLVSLWNELRLNKSFSDADELKESLSELGIKLTATPNGPRADVTQPFDPAKLEALK
jgi:cysteinyl-tRNA synthetase